MNALEARSLMGGDVQGNSLITAGPNHSKDDRSLRITFTNEGFVCHSFAGDDFKECRDFVKTALGLSDDWKPDPSQLKNVDHDADEAQKIEYALKIWRESAKPKATIVEAYLSKRGIKLDTGIQAIRYHGNLKHKDGQRYAAMVSLFRDVHTGEPCGVHRTYINPDATKHDKMMLGRAKRAAVMLDRDDDMRGLHVGEGIESCMSGRQLYGWRPMWALCSTSNIAKLPLINGLEAITFLGESDKRGANRKSTIECAARYREAGVETFLQLPDVVGDFNDELKAALHG